MPDIPDTKTSLLKGILVNLGAVSGYGSAPDVAPQILQAIVQDYGQSVATTADTQTSLLNQWLTALGVAYTGARQTEVSVLSAIYIALGGANDSTLPDHEIPLLRGIFSLTLIPAVNSYYFRPDGTSYYFRPDGTSYYFRP